MQTKQRNGTEQNPTENKRERKQKNRETEKEPT